MVTQKEFSGPITISFRWRWIDLAENPAYAEILSVAFRTSGEMRKEYTYEIEDGLVITIDTQEGGAYLSYATKGIKPRQRLIPSSGAEGRIPLPAHEWHDVRIVDDGSTVTLYLRGPATGIGETYWTKPLLQSRVEQTFAGKRIAIYNREIVGDAPHLSQIDDFVVERASAVLESDNEQ